MHKLLSLLVLVLAVSGGVMADEQVKTVIGPRNPDLAEGSEALLNGDAKKGIEFTRRGLENALGSRERQAGLNNLCVGYLMLEQDEVALTYCDLAIAENPNNWRALSNRALVYLGLGRFEEATADVDAGQAIAPNSRKLKEVRGMLLDETSPVTPSITIDDRREPDGD